MVSFEGYANQGFFTSYFVPLTSNLVPRTSNLVIYWNDTCNHRKGFLLGLGRIDFYKDLMFRITALEIDQLWKTAVPTV